jgi:hypothetical protein
VLLVDGRTKCLGVRPTEERRKKKKEEDRGVPPEEDPQPGVSSFTLTPRHPAVVFVVVFKAFLSLSLDLSIFQS